MFFITYMMGGVEIKYTFVVFKQTKCITDKIKGYEESR